MAIVARLKCPGGVLKDFTLPANGPLFIGRDVLGVPDKKCSRKQAQLIAHADGTITLTALGMNPIFVATKQEKKMIKQNEKATLCVGDTFCLVANEYPIELVQGQTKKELAIKPATKASAEVPPPSENDDMQPKPAAKPRRLLLEDTDEDEGLWSAAVKVGKKQSQPKDEPVPVKKPPPKRSITEDDEALARALAAAEEEEEVSASKARKGKAGASAGGGKAKLKRAVSDAYDVYNHSSDEDFIVADKASNLSGPKTLVRTRNRDKPYCRYGSKCYRKNPDHLAEFYHPSPESEEEEDAPSD